MSRAKLEKVPERVRSTRKLATAMQAPAQKHLSKQNVGKNKEGREKGDKNWKLQVISGQQLNEHGLTESQKDGYWEICNEKGAVTAG